MKFFLTKLSIYAIIKIQKRSRQFIAEIKKSKRKVVGKDSFALF